MPMESLSSHSQLEVALKWLAVIIAALALFVPSFIAHRRRVHSFRSISALNAFLLLTLVSTVYSLLFLWASAALWIAATVWAVLGRRRNAA